MRSETSSGGEVYEREFLKALKRHAEVWDFTPPLGWGCPPLIWAWAYRQLWKRPGTIIRAHSLRYLGLPAIFAARGRRVVVHCHHLERSAWGPLERWVLRHADRVTVDSEFGRDQVYRAGAWDVSVVPGGVDERFHRGIPVRPPFVLHVGARKPRKNPRFLESLRQRVRLKCFGEGWESQISESSKPTWYRLASLYVMPSTLEGFGLPVLEAMASGVPVIVSKEAEALRELVTDGIEGRVLPLDLSLWVKVIEELLSDRGLLEAMRASAIDRARPYTWDAAAKAWLKAVE